MKQKEGFILRDVCGEHVIVGEGLGTIDFGKLISLNETAAWMWRRPVKWAILMLTVLRLLSARSMKSLLNRHVMTWKRWWPSGKN